MKNKVINDVAKDYIDNVQKLVDCQLTEDEIGMWEVK